MSPKARKPWAERRTGRLAALHLLDLSEVRASVLAEAVEAPTGCWVIPNSDHRPQVRVAGYMWPVARLLMEIDHAPTLSKWVACHTCDYPGCVNPSHIYPGTYADNNADRTLRYYGEGSGERFAQNRATGIFHRGLTTKSS